MWLTGIEASQMLSNYARIKGYLLSNGLICHAAMLFNPLITFYEWCLTGKFSNLLKIIFVLLINLLCAGAPERNGEIMFQASKLTETVVRKAKVIHNTCDFTCLYVFDETGGNKIDEYNFSGPQYVDRIYILLLALTLTITHVFCNSFLFIHDVVLLDLQYM